MDNKNYLLDTNILINSPYAIFSFDEHNVFISDVTVEELDKLKTAPGETGANAREATRQIEKLRLDGNLLSGVALPNGGTFQIEIGKKMKLPSSWNPASPDNLIIATALEIAEANDGSPCILVSNDTNMRIKANIVGLTAEEYRTEQAKPDDEQYKGRRTVYTSAENIDLFYSQHYLLPEVFKQESPLVKHEFLTLKDEGNNAHGALARFDGNRIVPLIHADEQPFGITPRNSGQRFMQEALLAPADEVPLVIVKGAAGSAKTFMALACGLEMTLEKREYEQILVSRPNVKFDDDIGYLKGSEQEKIDPLIRPVYDNLNILTKINTGNSKEYDRKHGYTDSFVEDLFDDGIIVAQALAYMRGRSINNTWIIIDEAQNMSPLQAFGIISRVGFGSKVVLIGDPAQIDNPRLDSRTNGLVFASERMKGSNLCMQLTMESTECVRSELALEAISKLSPKGYNS